MALAVMVGRGGGLLRQVARHCALASYTSTSPPSHPAAILTHHHRYAHTRYQGFYRSGEALDDDIRWLFPATGIMERLSVAAKYGVLDYAFQITINSSQPVPPSAFEEAYHHLIRKIQSLRTCLRRREGRLWVCEPKRPKTDFKVTNNDADYELHAAMKPVFDHNEGPLVRVRLVPCVDSDPSPVPELRAAFPHQYHVTMGFFHAMNDGTTAYFIFMSLLKLLSDIIKSVPIDDSDITRLPNLKLTESMEQNIREYLENEPEKLHILLNELSQENFTPLIKQAFGDQDVCQPESRQISMNISTSLMEKFSAKCQAAGITLNTGVSCVTDRALVELVREAGMESDVYSVTSRHAVDERRYFHGNPVTDCGCFVRSMNHRKTESYLGRKEFWEYAKLCNEQFRKKLSQKSVYIEQILRSMLLPKDFSYESYYSSQHPHICDYYYSNLNRPQFNKWANDNTLMQVTDFRAATEIINSDFSNFHGITHIHNGYRHTLIYSTANLTDDMALNFQRLILQSLNDLAN